MTLWETPCIIHASANEYCYGSLSVVFQKALDILEQGIGVEICLAPGTYRESIYIPQFPGKAYSAPLIIRSSGRAILTGLDPIDNITWEYLGNGIYRTRLPVPRGMSGDPWFPVKDPVGWRSDLVRADGLFLRPVTLERYFMGGFWNVETAPEDRGIPEARYLDMVDPRDKLKPGDFAVTERESLGACLYVRLLGDRDPAEAEIEFSHRGELFRCGAKNKLCFENITFEGAATFPKEGFESPIQFDGLMSELVFSNCSFEWNSAFGLNLNTIEDLEISNCCFSHNGYGGLGLGKVYGLRISDSRFICNDWRNRLGGSISLSHCTAGIKAHLTRNAKVVRSIAAGNGINGIWFDVQCADVTVERSLCAYNKREGLFFEFSPGPCIASMNVLLSNGAHDYLIDVVGSTEATNNLIWSKAANSGSVQGEGTVAIGQGMRYNEHADPGLVPGIHHVLADNTVIIESSNIPVLSIHNRVGPEQVSQSDMDAYHRFPACIHLDGNRWILKTTPVFRYYDERQGTMIESSTPDGLPISSHGRDIVCALSDEYELPDGCTSYPILDCLPALRRDIARFEIWLAGGDVDDTPI